MTMMKKIKNVTVFRNVNLKKSFVAVVMYNSTHKHITVSIEIWIKLFIQPDVDLAYICVYVFVFIYIYKKKNIYIYIYIQSMSICIQQLFRSLRAHQYSSDQKKILKDLIYMYLYICLYILNKKTHFQLSEIFRLFYITFYSVCE